jgi:hypothetical protein
VDQQTGAGVGSVDVGLVYLPGPMSSAFSAFGTQSDQNGNFTIGPVFAESSVKLVFQGEYLGYREAEDASLTVRAGVEYSIGEIPVLVYRDLEKLLELPDVSKSTTIEAVGVLQTALARVRARILEVQQWQSGQNSTDSISLAEVTAAERFGEAFLKLSQRTSDPELAFQILTEYLRHVDSSKAPSFYVGRAKTAFLERYLEREDVMDILPSILPPDDAKSWRHVYDRSKNDAAKTLACQHLIHNALSEFYFLATWEGYSDKQFADRLAESRQLWKFAYRESANQLSNETTLKHYVEGRLRQTLSELRATSAPNPARLDQLRRTIEEQLAK